MVNVKDRIIGAVTIMDEDDAVNLWELIKKTYKQK